MTDTPVLPQTFPPPSPADKVKAFIGDLARPFAMYVLSGATAVSIVIVALRVENGNDGAIFLGAAGVLVGGMFGFKAWENNTAAKQATEVAKATGSGGG
ncbi:MAG: hypothetical protein WAW13_00500 [Minisyncoccia bacterium]